MKKLVICNHKMFLTYDEALAFKEDLERIDLSNINFIVCPGYLNLNIFKDYNLGSQDAFYHDRGPYTSEVSAYELSLLGVKYSLIGHYERRKYDSDEIINKKVKSVLNNSMTPILCIGETKIDKELLRTSIVLKKQITSALSNISLDKTQQIIIAYEPIWAIGNRNELDKKQIEDALKYIKKIVEECNIHNYKLIYGGSINSKNIKKILSDSIDGYLIGSSSVNIDELKNIINSIK